jgi:hypothetical protein
MDDAHSCRPLGTKSEIPVTYFVPVIEAGEGAAARMPAQREPLSKP